VIRVGPLVYLEVQKTGSTFIRASLELLARPGSAVVKTRKHKPPSSSELRGATSIAITVRHPENYYPSLFRSGMRGRGQIHGMLESMGATSLYRPDPDAFFEWHRLLLSDHVQARLRRSLGLKGLREPMGILSLRVAAQLQSAIPRLIRFGRVQPVTVLPARDCRIRVLHSERLDVEFAALISEHSADFVQHGEGGKKLLEVNRNATNERIFTLSAQHLAAMSDFRDSDRVAVELWGS
jgi:hypothetical protein